MRKSLGPSLILVGRIWHYRFARAGKRVQRSTGEIDRSKAEAIAWEAWGRATPVPTLRQLAESWLEIHELTRSCAHLRSVRDFWRGQLYELGDIRIDQIRTADVERARNQHLASGHALESANLWLRVLRLLYGWATAEGRELIPAIPWKLSRIKTQKKPRYTLPTSKAAVWMEALDRAAGKRWGLAAVVRLMLGIGLRESEALSARWEWIDWERAKYTPGLTKGKEADRVPVPPWLLRHLGKRRRAEGLIAESPRGGRYGVGATRDLILRANKAVGIAGLTPHRLRGTFATQMSEEGMPLEGIQRLLRHKDPRTTMGYVEVDQDRAVQVQEEIAKKMGFWRKSGEAGSGKPHGARENIY